MVLYPQVMRRAQEQIDLVVGRDRLPTFADRKALPYIEAIAKETLRWRTVTPLSFARRATEVCNLILQHLQAKPELYKEVRC